MLLIWLYPLLFLLPIYYSISPNREAERDNFSFRRHSLFSVAFIVPWIMVQMFPSFDIWLLSGWLMSSLVLMLVKRELSSQESWFKAVVSYFVGLSLLELSLHPTYGLPFPIAPRLDQAIVASGFICGIFLILGLPPLQLGVIDLGSESNSTVQAPLNLLLRFTLIFIILCVMSYSPWIESIGPLHGLIIGSLFLGLGLSRVVLRLQTSIFRTMAYLISGLALVLIVKLIYPEFADAALVVLVFIYSGIYLGFDRQALGGGSESELLNWTSFQDAHGDQASRILTRIFNSYFYFEGLVTLLLGIQLFCKGSVGAGLAALFCLLCIFAVTQDQQAFKPRMKVHP